MADLSKKTGGAAARSRQAAQMGEPDSKKILRVALMIICCGAAGYFFWTNMQIVENVEISANEVSKPQPPDPAMESEKGEITAAEESMKNMTDSSSQAKQIALLAELQNTNPVDVANSLLPREQERIIAGSDAPPPPMPPDVTVVAIMITDTGKVAMLNVDGEQGILLREGAKFSEGKATLTKIDAKGVSYRWMRQNLKATL